MIGSLPKSLLIDGVDYPIRSDYRVILTIFDAFGDPNLSMVSKQYIMLDAIYKDVPSNKSEAIKQAVWFINGGKEEENEQKPNKKLMDWHQDEQMIFSAVNSVAGKEIRNEEYLHWWTFLGYFNEIREGLFSTVVSIRKKKATGKKLEKWEQEFYRKNTDLIKLKQRYSDEQQQEINELNALLNGG